MVMKIAPKQTESFYIKLNSAFAFIFILVVVASSFGIYILYNLGQVIKTTEKETFPATLAAMRLSERTALIAASAPALAAASKDDEIKNIYVEFEKHMKENRIDLQGLYKMGDPHTLAEVENSLEKVAVIETSLREIVKEKFDLSKSRHEILDNLLKLQADLDDTLGPLIWGTTSLTKLLGKRTARMITQNIDQRDNPEEIRSFINIFTDTALEPLQIALDIKAESALLISLLNMALHVATSDDIFPLENRASRSLNVFLQALKKFDKSELSKRNPILSVNLSRIEKSFTEIAKNRLNPFDIRRKEIEKEVAIISLLNQGRQEAKTLSQQIEIIVKQVQQNLHHQAELVSKRRLMGVAVLVAISLVSCLLSILVAILTTRTLKNRDIAIQQAVVEAERANRIKSQFLANMSHEIRTPMNSVLGFLELVLEDGSLTNDQRKQLSTAHSSAKGLLSLINDILDMNKLESGKVIIENVEFSLNRLIEQIFQIMDIKAREKGVAFSYSIHDSLSCVFSGDALRIRQVIINLVGNAIKFTHNGNVKLKIMPDDIIVQDGIADLNKPIENSLIAHFTIEDTGIGIAPDRIANIFEPFTQADSSTTRKYGGTGLGTTISKQIVELMNGQIWVESQEGKGTVFHFTLPLLKVDEPSAISEISLTSLGGTPLIGGRSLGSGSSFNSFRTFKILVAEDVEANALLVRTRLKLQGHDITIAKNGLEAVKAFEKGNFDIILMDVHMPEMDGIEATIKIRQIEEVRGGHIPIVALTASVMKDEIKRFITTGMDSFVGKPIDFNELAKTMDKYIPNSEPSGLEFSSLDTNGSELIKKAESISKSNPPQLSQYVDFEDGLERWQDISIYIEALSKFADDYGNIIPEIERLINFDKFDNKITDNAKDKADADQEKANIEEKKADIEEAYKITHAIKGVAANLSLKELAQIATQINLALHKSSITDIKNTIPILSKSLENTLNEIELLKSKYLKKSDQIDVTDFAAETDEETLDEKVDKRKNIKNIDAVRSIINQLKENIEQYSTDGIEPLLDDLEQHILPEHLKSIKKCVDDLDFGGAEKELEKLITRLETNQI
ncbi:MAG: response regulator [Desulfamplus sp.]|nr:response regulator [Desulfamplus sp.]